MFTLLLIIIVLFLLFQFIRQLTKKQPLVDAVETVNPTFVGRLRGQLRSWRGLTATRTSSTAQQLQTWAAQNLAETSPLRSWLLALTEEEITILGERLDNFCVDLGFTFDWLFDPLLLKNLALNSAMTAAVTAYCTAVWQTVSVREDIHAYKAFLAFEQEPQKSTNREFAQRFYAQLMAKGLIPTTPPDLVLSSDEERDTYVMVAIRQAAQQDQFAFQQTLREVTQGTNGLWLTSN